jgi:hypothetical protein
MSRYVFIHHGYEEPTKQVMDAWMAWFGEIADSTVDIGAPFGPGREVTPTGARDLPSGPEAATGYTVVEAADMAAAEKLLEHCPIIGSVRIYEAMQMNG